MIEMFSYFLGQTDTSQTGMTGTSCTRMVRRMMCFITCVALWSSVVGCSSLTGQRVETPTEAQNRQLLAQIQELTVKAENLDTLNEQYQKNLGQSFSLNEKTEQELTASQQQLAELTNKVTMLEAELAQSRQSVQSFQASMHRQSTVTVVPNSSFHNQQLAISSPGVSTKSDGDFIRVRIPDAYLFQSGSSWEISTEGRRTLTEVGNQLRLNFPNQEIAIEGHTNQLAVNSQRKLNAHELGTKKAFAVADYLVNNNILEDGCLRIGGAGANRPVDYSGTTEAEMKNSRIEFVVYPTTWK